MLCRELVRQTAVLAGLRTEVGQTAQGWSGMSVPTSVDLECSRESPHPAIHPANTYYMTAKGDGCNGSLECGGRKGSFSKSKFLRCLLRMGADLGAVMSKRDMASL